MQRKFDILGVFIVLVILATLASACGAQPLARPSALPAGVTPTPFLSTSTPMPTFTPTAAPLGSPQNPIVMAIIGAEPDSAQIGQLDSLTAQLSGFLGLAVSGRSYPDYISLETALQKQEVHLAWLNPVEYLLASDKDLLSSQLVANHLGVTAYGVQFLGHKDANLTRYFDAGTNLATAPAATALPQFAGLTPCLTNEKSLPGYWVPLGYLAQTAVPTQSPVLTKTYSAGIRALYIKGVCDFTATYAISSDPRTSSEVISDLPDVIDRVPIIWLSPAVIPNLGFSVSPLLPLPLTAQITNYLLELSRTESGRNQLTELNAYEIARLEPQPDDAYNELRKLLAVQNLRLSNLLP